MPAELEDVPSLSLHEIPLTDRGTSNHHHHHKQQILSNDDEWYPGYYGKHFFNGMVFKGRTQPLLGFGDTFFFFNTVQ